MYLAIIFLCCNDIFLQTSMEHRLGNTGLDTDSIVK
jgi:hypothetical protein